MFFYNFSSMFCKSILFFSISLFSSSIMFSSSSILFTCASLCCFSFLYSSSSSLYIFISCSFFSMSFIVVSNSCCVFMLFCFLYIVYPNITKSISIIIIDIIVITFLIVYSLLSHIVIVLFKYFSIKSCYSSCVWI